MEIPHNFQMISCDFQVSNEHNYGQVSRSIIYWISYSKSNYNQTSHGKNGLSSVWPQVDEQEAVPLAPLAVPAKEEAPRVGRAGKSQWEMRKTIVWAMYLYGLNSIMIYIYIYMYVCMYVCVCVWLKYVWAIYLILCQLFWACIIKKSMGSQGASQSFPTTW